MTDYAPIISAVEELVHDTLRLMRQGLHPDATFDQAVYARAMGVKENIVSQLKGVFGLVQEMYGLEQVLHGPRGVDEASRAMEKEMIAHYLEEYRLRRLPNGDDVS